MYRLLSFVAVVVVFFIQFIIYRLLSFVAVVVVFFIQFIMYRLVVVMFDIIFMEKLVDMIYIKSSIPGLSFYCFLCLCLSRLRVHYNFWGLVLCKLPLSRSNSLLGKGYNTHTHTPSPLKSTLNLAT